MAQRILSLREIFRRLPADGKVRHLLRSFNLGMSGCGPLPSAHKLAKELGFDVFLCDLPPNVRGRLERDTFSENGYRIEVNKSDNVRVRRFTVLHEIFHFYCHCVSDPFAAAKNRAGGQHFYDFSEQREEREANEFAEALIFGDGALEAAIGLFGRDEALLAKQFGVTPKTLELALRKLDASRR